MTKKQEPEAIILDTGERVEFVWRIWHRPSQVYFKPGKGFYTKDTRLAKTYSRKPSLSVAMGGANLHKQIYNYNTCQWCPRSEFEVVEYGIVATGKVYDR